MAMFQLLRMKDDLWRRFQETSLSSIRLLEFRHVDCHLLDTLLCRSHEGLNPQSSFGDPSRRRSICAKR